ncbi:helix-turn-helix domain-containing protein [Kribbella monticola]|uniref:helix-turn-helix domain-containing protein n=1 Tax=Kribbella monticola TaxID=2185285 RepID=UPI000DD44CD5|nr:helix-turn-helix transcriptional regulator [Kribbella monticola]
MPSPKGKAPLSPTTAEFGRRVRERRNELGLSQEALADACGLHWTFIGQVERGQRNLALHNIVKVAAGLGVDPGRLVAALPVPAELDPD